MSEQAPPFSKERYKLTIYKIIMIYAPFYMVLKLFAISKGSWVLPNLILCLPVLAIGLVAWWQFKNEKTNWIFIVLSVFVVSALRTLESDWVVWLNDNL